MTAPPTAVLALQLKLEHCLRRMLASPFCVVQRIPGSDSTKHTPRSGWFFVFFSPTEFAHSWRGTLPLFFFFLLLLNCWWFSPASKAPAAEHMSPGDYEDTGRVIEEILQGRKMHKMLMALHLSPVPSNFPVSSVMLSSSSSSISR